MTALTKYERLEATALWRPEEGGQRQNVLLSLGDATLTITDMHEHVLTHWSLPAICRKNPGERPALFAPGENLREEIEVSDTVMVDAIEKVRKLVERRKPQPGRLRHWIAASVLIAVVALSVFWLPNALQDYTVSVVPEPTRSAIGQRVLNRIGRVAGKECEGRDGRAALARLTERVTIGTPPRVVVLSGGVQTTSHLPGNITLVNRALLEDFDEPDVIAGFLLSEELRREQVDPMRPLLDHAGTVATARLLTTGDLPDGVIDAYAEWLLTQPRPEQDATALLDRFATIGVRSTPYAYALDLTGETTIALIEADPVSFEDATPLLTDADWVRVQGICGE